MTDSSTYATTCLSLRTELAAGLAKFTSSDSIDIWRTASIVHEELFSKTDATVIRLRQFHDITNQSEIYTIYTESLTTLLLMVNLRAFSSLAVIAPPT